MVMGLMMIINQAVGGGKKNQWLVASGQWSVAGGSGYGCNPSTDANPQLATGH
jgi:hypothetical protein